MANSHKKGGKNEREVANALSSWAGFEFARVPMSGGLGWKNRMQVTGDVIPTNPKDMISFPFSVEAKFYKEIDLEAPLLGNNCKWLEWWIQAASDARDADKLGLLLMRRNMMAKGEYFTVVEYEVFQELETIPSFRNPRGYYIYNDELVIFSSRDLFKAKYLDVETYLNKIKWND